MTNRIRRLMVTLVDPFLLTGLGEPIPAGRYEITTEEEPLGDLMRPAYRRVSATIYVQRVPGRLGVSQNIELTTSELNALFDPIDRASE